MICGESGAAGVAALMAVAKAYRDGQKCVYLTVVYVARLGPRREEE